MGKTQLSSLQDKCQVGVYSTVQNNYGELVPGYTWGSEIKCGFDPTGGQERPRPEMTPLIVNATVRLPLGTAINTTDRIRITKRYRTTLTTALEFEIIGAPQTGPSGIVLELSEVTI